jgi:hypothetical protein
MLSMRASVIRRPHYEPQGPATRPDSQGNWATARSPALGILSHTCTERTSCRTEARAAQQHIAGRSPEPPLYARKRRLGWSAR